MAIYSCGAKYYFGEKNKKGRIYALCIFGGAGGMWHLVNYVDMYVKYSDGGDWVKGYLD